MSQQSVTMRLGQSYSGKFPVLASRSKSTRHIYPFVTGSKDDRTLNCKPSEVMTSFKKDPSGIWKPRFQ